MTGRLKPLTIFLFTILIVIITISYWKVQQDDAYIFYTYAKNISSGNGYVFNLGDKLNATTSPLYTLLLALASFIFKSAGLSIPLIGHLIGGISLWFISYFLFKLFEDEQSIPISIFLPIVFLINPLLKNAVGMETFLNLAFVMASFFYYKKENYLTASICSALAVLSRFDSMLVVLILFVDFIFTKKKLPEYKTFLIFILITLPWFIFSKIYFGSFLPTTVSIKLNQHQTSFWGSGLIFLKGFETAFLGNKIISFAAITLFAVSFLLIFLKRKSLLKEKTTKLILIWSVVYFVVYSFILNPPSYGWYYTPFAIIMSLIITQAIGIIFTDFFQWTVLKSISILVILFFIGLILPVRNIKGHTTSKYENYKAVAYWLNQNAENNSSVAIDEIGVLGFYYNNGKIIDILGLVNPDIVPHLVDKDYFWYINQYKPDYIVTDYPSPPEYSKIVFSNNFKDRYSTSIIIKAGNRETIIFAKRK
ncbi:MAG: hypothetical protein M1480_15240 [Bacteroidetes bacterium]|nr:hypothetical protein [Bacteroidota bacterium]